MIKIAPTRAITLLFVLGCILYVLAVIVVTLRLIVLFPAIAVDAPGATWRNAMADTKGNAWRILFIGLLASLPLFGIVLLLMMIGFAVDAPISSARPSIGWIAITTIFDAAFSVLGFTIAVVVASRLYEQLANRLRQQP